MKQQQSIGTEFHPADINVMNLLEYTEKAIITYGAYTIQDRAIPELKDGLKPVYRRLVWAGYTGGYTSKGPTKKCARIVGDAMGKYHPHGDSALYGALVTIAKTATPLFTSQGNFGDKVLGTEAAAMRYTEAKLSSFSDAYLLDRDYLAVTPMVPNYDGKEMEPVYLPAKVPVVLLQGIEGIATGAATVIPSFSFESVKALTKKVIKTGKCTPKMCVDTLEFKFAEGGAVWAEEKELETFYKRGEAKLFVVPDCEYDENEHAVVMTSYCPRLKLEKVFEQGLTVNGVADVEDGTGARKGSGKGKNTSQVRILFRLNKSIPKVKGKLYVEKVQQAIGTSISYSIMITDRSDDGIHVSFQYSNVVDIMLRWVKWRLEFEIKVVNRLINLTTEKIQRLNWLLWAVKNLELVFQALKTKDPDAFLVKKGEITQEHAKYILDQQVRRLSRLEGENISAQIKEQKAILVKLKKDTASEEAVRSRVHKQL